MNSNLASAGAPRSNRLWLGAGACLLLVSLGALLLWPSDEPAASVVPPLRVSTATAGPAMLNRSVQVNGALVAREEIAISSSVPEQRVAKVNVEEGDSVQAQQLLARLETQGLDAQVRQAQAVWARARAAVGHQAAVTVEAQATFKRIESLGESGAVSAQQVDERRAQADSAAANLRAARAEVEQALAQLAGARHQRSRADIRAPFAGVIVERMARTGALSGGEPMFRLVREGAIEFEGELAETDLVDITLGQTLSVRIAGISSPIKGTIRRVVPKVDARSRLGRVRIELGYSPLLRVGTYAQATLLLAPLKLDVALPARAFSIIDGHRAWVMRINDQGLITRQTVATGRRSGDLLEIVSGLQAGERVVANASAFVREGDVVIASAAPAPQIEDAP
ncbi:efflux RND transporter periplasmic adaptor subunit [Pseudomonas proteolytica]|uniref:efflux RND transporter periplasmic adaptor subunit n=1 Tax=Pseudomonas proteolytica TaxID=219574 RepID=UPI003209E8CB